MERELGRRRGNYVEEENEDDGEIDLDDERTMAEEEDDGLDGAGNGRHELRGWSSTGILWFRHAR